MSDTMFTFNDNNLTPFLTKEELKAKCPMAFKTQPTNPDVSDKYMMATTVDVINDMEKLGWFPVDAKQCRTNKNSKGIKSFHMIAFQNPNVFVLDSDDNIDGWPRIILTSSHDGFHSFTFRCGFYKFLCSNGLVLSEAEFTKFSIRHVNCTFEDLKTMITQVTIKIPEIIGVIERMKEYVLTKKEKYEIASSFFNIRNGFPINKKVDNSIILNILKPNRKEDENNNLWSIFNTCQENIIKGNFSIENKNGKLRKLRPIKSIKKDLSFNQKFWEISQKYVQLS